ncbi:asparaginyl-tRNA synthetase [Calocera cornea HHB12733]|uniref:asparagine--tRNA ligase n=1 Tax=Calocera cornea HHB12733 TaxID=1353952 RepID=A0A165IZC2_9BASI|nr:asparaginyl-tRNA synthetase [Calocera cornea HHB12733]
MASIVEKVTDKIADLGLTGEKGPDVYVDEETGSDETGTGTAEAPYATAIHALTVKGQDVNILTRKKTADEFQQITKSGLKSAKKAVDNNERKAKRAGEEAEKNAKAAAEAKAREEKRIEESKKVILVEDPSLPKATRSKLEGLAALRGKRVRVFGWVHRLRQQKDMTFIVLRDGTGFLQCILAGKCAQTYDALMLTTESTVELVGTVQAVPEGKTAPGGHELIVDYWHTLGAAPGGDDAFTNKFNEHSDPSVLADLRHLTLRGETAAAVLHVRAGVLSAFRATYAKHSLTEVTPPCMVQTQVEGGSTLFEFNYYGEKAYLTQSSQLYLETCLPSLGDVFCIQESFRAEKSLTRRHLSEYTHLEAELAFINFDDLMTHIESIICETIDLLLADPRMAELIQTLNPGFKPPKRPFMRLDYKDAIKYLNEHGIQRPDEETGEIGDHVIGDDIAEAAERQMTDQLGVPIFLNKFPKEIKAFYMKKVPGDPGFTESVDLLMPGVGEIVGGSMRIADMQELLEGYKREGIDPAPYYWFTDQRKYGTCEHGGYGLGVERFLAWLTKRFTVRECSLYPRWMGRATP